MKKFNLAITIKSFNSDSLSRYDLKKNCIISFLNTTGRHLTEPELIEALKQADGVIAGTERFSQKVLKSSPRLKVISRVGVGLDTIDLEVAKKYKIKICSTPESPVQAVAEHTLALLFSLMKHIPMYNSNMRTGNYQLRSGSLLYGKTVGIVGMGRIGQKVAAYLAGFGCRIVYYDPFVQKEMPVTWEKMTRLEELVKISDIITLHSPPQQDGSPIITAELMEKFRRGVIIINTARGSILDEQALMKGLDSEIISGAGLDVFSYEPYAGSLLKYPQVIVTPHVSSNTLESRNQMEMEAVDNILTAIKDVVQ